MPARNANSTGHDDDESRHKTVQDDARERYLRDLYRLEKPPGSGRSGIDGVLKMPDGRKIEFELKSATKKGITTGRDISPTHLEKWSKLHWLIGFFQNGGTDLKDCLYASPTLMKPWIDGIAKRIKLDLDLAHLARQVDRSLFASVLSDVFGDKEVYTVDDAKAIQKKQYKESEYTEKMDRDGGYSKDRMLEILADRWVYLTKRGSTLNNPHIPPGHYESFVRLSTARDQAHDCLIRAVTQAIENP